jgi:hypothetical protein
MSAPEPSSDPSPIEGGTAPRSNLRLPGDSPGSWVRWLYLALAISGAVLPWMANWEFIQSYWAVFDLGLFVRMAGANPAAQSLSRDLLIASSAITVWIVIESRRLRMRGLPWVLLSCATVAFAFGAPLFLYLRERRLDELARLNAR